VIEIQLNTDLHDSRITSLITKDAVQRPNIHLLHAPELTKAPYIEYQILGDAGDQYDEGELSNASVTLQIDIYTHGAYLAIRDAVKTVLLEKGYIYPSTGGFESLYEPETKLFHCILRFTKEYEII